WFVAEKSCRRNAVTHLRYLPRQRTVKGVPRKGTSIPWDGERRRRSAAAFPPERQSAPVPLCVRGLEPARDGHGGGGGARLHEQSLQRRCQLAAITETVIRPVGERPEHDVVEHR